MPSLSALFSHNALLAATLVLVIGLWAYADRKADRRNEPVAAYLIAVALWLYAYVLWRTSDGPRQAVFWLRTLFFIASVLPPLLFLVIASRWKGAKTGAPFVAALLAPNALIFWAAYFTDTFVPAAGTPMLATFGARAAGAYFAFCAVAAFDAALRTSREEAVEDSRMLALVGGLFASLAAPLAMLYFADLAAASDPLWYGHQTAIILAFGSLLVAYAVNPDRFRVALHPVGLEAFASMGILALVFDVIFSQTALRLTVRLVMLIILVIAGSAATRGAAREIARLRQIERMNEEIVRMNGRLIEADRMKTRLVSFASHQLRAPIGGVKSYLDMLDRGDFGTLNARQKEIVETNIDVIGRMAETVETFLDVAKIDLGKSELFRTETNLAALVSRVVAALTPLVAKKRVTLETDFPTDLPNAACDSGKLYHAMANLVHNAIKYTEKGRIIVSCRRDGTSAVFAVRDTGIGLSPAGKKKVRALLDGGIDHVKFDETGGSGLGLYIVKAIIEAHGGEVTFDSPGKGKGSTFGFRVPLA